MLGFAGDLSVPGNQVRETGGFAKFFKILHQKANLQDAIFLTSDSLCVK
jgi:hypothetical protein